MKIAKVISGGQSGADEAGLFAAAALGLPTGGYAPRGYKTERGSANWLKEYGLLETKSESYSVRTALNVKHSDLTLICGNQDSSGSKLTRRYCNENNRPYISVVRFDAEEKQTILESLDEMGDNLVINIAGNRESVNRGINKLTFKFLKEVFEEAQNS